MKTSLLVVGSFLLIGAGCARPGQKPAEVAPTSVAGDLAALSMIYAGGEALEGAPTVYELLIAPRPQATPIRRAGDLPAAGAVISLPNLPAADAAVVTGALYKDKFLSTAKTHTCAGDAPVQLVPGATASLALTCVALANDDGSLKPVKVFVKVAQASLNLSEKNATQVLAARDWAQKALFAFQDEKGRRVSLKQDAFALTVHVGGDLSYAVANEPAPKALPLQRLILGEALTATAVGGHLLDSSPEDATLKLSGPALLFEEDNGDLKGLLPIKLANGSGSLTVDGRLLEEPANSEFTVVSYNVENFFDQQDEDRNASYGDYRLAPNAQGQFSNWGAAVTFQGQSMSFTEVKALGIRKVLQGIDPAGPEIVGMVEVESQGSLDVLLEKVKDLGYVTAQFSQWTPDLAKSAVGTGILSKFPLKKYDVVPVPTTGEPSRPVLKATLDVDGHDLVVYVNHWKSKGGPESLRKLYAQALEDDVQKLLAADPKADFLIVGDLNSDYNEKVIIAPEHNDTNRTTGINDVLHAQGDELLVAKGTPGLKYNLEYELDRAARRSAWYPATGWASLDHIIQGPGLYDRTGISYVDNSFQIATTLMPRLSFAFTAGGTPNRWHSTRVNSKETRHEVGGFSDHLPLFARYNIITRQSAGGITLLNPGKPDATDTITPPTH